MDSTWFQVIAILAICFQALVIFLALFEPALRYKVARAPSKPLDSDEFCSVLAALADAPANEASRVEVFTNGENFYEAELEAIRQAKRTINLEAYIFQRGKVARRFLQAMTERARAGVQVNIVMDAVGSFATTRGYCKELIEAGGRVEFYHPFRWNTLPRINSRTHRELLIIDCEAAFIGGAGFADHWLISKKRRPRWRDTVVKVTGDAVASLQGSFAENWLEASGELLTADEYFCFNKEESNSAVLVVDSTASSGGSTRARMLFQLLMASARKSIYVTTPYFLPDVGVRKELIKAVRDRGVDVKIIAPGKHSDHLLTRRSSRRLYGELLKAGVEIYEYKPSMLHTKSMVIDGIWSVVGSTNFDHRSFSINDELNIASNDQNLAKRLHEDFVADLAAARNVRYKEWKRRPIFERLHEALGRVLERQQ